MFFWVWRFLRHGTLRHALGLVALAATIVVLGGVAFALAEHISIWIGLYWSVTTATTVGYGDVTPHTPAGHIIAVVVMLSTIPMLGAVFAIWSGSVAAARVRRLLQMGRSFPEGAFRLVVGMHPAVPAVMEELVRTGHDVVLVADVDPAHVPDEVHLVRGDPASLHTLRSAHPEKAEQVLVTGTGDGDVLVAVVLLRQCAPNAPMTALAHSSAASQALKDLGVTETISGDELLSHTLAKALETPHAASLLLELLDSSEHYLDEMDLSPNMAGRLLSSVRDERSDLVLGLVHDGSVTLGIGSDPSLATGDRLLVARPISERPTSK